MMIGFWCRFVSLSVLLDLGLGWRSLQLILSQLVAPDFGWLAPVWMILMVAVPVCALLSIPGLWNARHWGFLAFYLYVVLSSLLFSNVSIPFASVLLSLAAFEAKFAAGIALNGFALGAVAVLHWKSARNR